jgi:hypothetical protein
VLGADSVPIQRQRELEDTELTAGEWSATLAYHAGEGALTDAGTLLKYATTGKTLSPGGPSIASHIFRTPVKPKLGDKPSTPLELVMQTEKMRAEPRETVSEAVQEDLSALNETLADSCIRIKKLEEKLQDAFHLLATKTNMHAATIGLRGPAQEPTLWAAIGASDERAGHVQKVAAGILEELEQERARITETAQKLGAMEELYHQLQGAAMTAAVAAANSAVKERVTSSLQSRLKAAIAEGVQEVLGSSMPAYVQGAIREALPDELLE